jgi:hypothetical protein
MILELITNRYRIVAVTNQRILILDAGPWSYKKARRVVEILPRATRLGPVKREWHSIDLHYGRILVNRRFSSDIDAADRRIPNHDE